MHNNPSQTEDPNKPWVGLWMGRRHVVFDREIQPQDTQYMLIYFVEGKSLCFRDKEIERKHVKTIRNQQTIDFAIEQYVQWKRNNQDQLANLMSETAFHVQEPASLKMKCLECGGEGITYSRIGTFSDGAFSDGVNQREVCNHCNGTGFVANIY